MPPVEPSAIRQIQPSDCPDAGLPVAFPVGDDNGCPSEHSRESARQIGLENISN